MKVYILVLRPSVFTCHKHLHHLFGPTPEIFCFFLLSVAHKHFDASLALIIKTTYAQNQDIWLFFIRFVGLKALSVNEFLSTVLPQHLFWPSIFQYLSEMCVSLIKWIYMWNNKTPFSIFTLHYRAGLDYLQQVRSTAYSDQLLGVCLWLHEQSLLDLLENKETNMKGF